MITAGQPFINCMHCPCRYLEMRQRKLPALEKEHSHARVPCDELQARMTRRLVTSAVAPLALLQWQLSGRSPPLQLTAPVRTTKPTGLGGGAGSTSAQHLPGAGTALQRHNMLACRHWALCQVAATASFAFPNAGRPAPSESCGIRWRSMHGDARQRQHCTAQQPGCDFVPS